MGKLDLNMSNLHEIDCGNVIIKGKDSSWCVIDQDGNTIVPFGKYAWIDKFIRGYARVKSFYADPTKELWGIIDTTGRLVIKTRYQEIWRFKEEYDSVRVKIDGLYKNLPFKLLDEIKRKKELKEENDYFYHRSIARYRDDYYSYEDSYLDALDGEIEAYWNID